jgi:hypothetical protein
MSSLPEDIAARALEVEAPLPEEHVAPLRAVPPRRRRQPRLGVWIGSIVSATSLFLLVAFNVFMVQGQFDLDRIAEQRLLEQKQYEKLRAEVALASSPETIVAKARALGFVDPQSVTYVEAPAAGSTEPPADRTTETLQEASAGAKGHLAAGP